ncbi:hypothetical protein KAX02_05560 [candidate division WOR-3 bacterium]|nr:hypothetical protein [candidate division WOR-3 bacterium]
MKFSITLKLENEDNEGEISSFNIEGNYQRQMYELFEKQKPVTITLNDSLMGEYIITAFTSKIENDY